jgi:hypothetical protein
MLVPGRLTVKVTVKIRVAVESIIRINGVQRSLTIEWE